jgi:hypothetical protein
VVEPLSRTTRLVLLAVLLAPVVLLVVHLRGGTREVTARAELELLRDGRTVRSSFSENTCGAPLRLEVVESAAQVRVRTVVLREHGARVSCEDVAIEHTLTVVLDAPLGDRRLVAVLPRTSAHHGVGQTR